MRSRTVKQCYLRALSDCRLTDTHNVERVTIVKPREVKLEMTSRHVRAAMLDPERIQGGNWKMQGFRRSGLVHDEAECQMSIAEFMAEQGLQRDSYNG